MNQSKLHLENETIELMEKDLNTEPSDNSQESTKCCGIYCTNYHRYFNSKYRKNELPLFLSRLESALNDLVFKENYNTFLMNLDVFSSFYIASRLIKINSIKRITINVVVPNNKIICQWSAEHQKILKNICSKVNNVIEIENKHDRPKFIFDLCDLALFVDNGTQRTITLSLKNFICKKNIDYVTIPLCQEKIALQNTSFIF